VIARSLFPLGESGLRKHGIAISFLMTITLRQTESGKLSTRSAMLMAAPMTERSVFVMRDQHGDDCFAFPVSARGNMPGKSN
jgi:hypothetical protein